MSRYIQKVIIASLNAFKLLSMCAKFQVNKWQFSIQKNSLATADIICWEWQ